MTLVARQATFSTTPQFVLRAEASDAGLLARSVTRQGVKRVLLPGSATSAAGVIGSLDEAVRAAGASLYVDPETPLLAESALDSPRVRRVRRTPVAQVLDGRYLPAAGLTSGIEDALLEAAWTSQRDAAVLASPYLALDDERARATSLDWLARTANVRDDRPILAFMELSRETLLTDIVPPLASRYRTAGADAVVLRVVDLDAERVDADDIDAVIHAVDSLREAGTEPLPEGFGRFGSALTAIGAAGFVDGIPHFRRVVGRTGDVESVDPVGVEVPFEWRALPRVEAKAGAIPSCGSAGCRALSPGRSSGDLRDHVVHTFVALAELPPEQVVATLTASPWARARLWGERLRLYAERRATA